MADREEVIKCLEKCRRCECDDCTEKGASQAQWDCPAFDDFVDNALSLLKEQETKIGHWFISEYEYLNCSCCGESYYTGATSTKEARQMLASGQYYKYCPYCGAKMTDRR